METESVAILDDRLYFSCYKNTFPIDDDSTHYFCTDNTLQYEPFFSDFGPLNLSHLYRFCRLLTDKLEDSTYEKKKIVYYCRTIPQRRSNSAVLIGCYSVLYLGLSPSAIWDKLKTLSPFLPFRDAGMGVCTFKLTVRHCIQAVAKAKRFRFFDFDTFNAEEYEYFECVENGDLNTMIPGKFIAFSGPHATNMGADGYPTMTPEDYMPIWKKYGVGCVVRLNKKLYDKKRFTERGISHYDLYFVDGTAPSLDIVWKFIALAEKETQTIAVHCKAGLGRTGTLIGCYMMKHYRLSAAESIAWLRICRPGSVIGPQQNFMKTHQKTMWLAGREVYLAKRGELSSLLVSSSSSSSSSLDSQLNNLTISNGNSNDDDNVQERDDVEGPVARKHKHTSQDDQVEVKFASDDESDEEEVNEDAPKKN